MNNATLGTLREEHRNLSGLLDILEQQMHGIHRGHSPDYEVMLDLLDYFLRHPGRCHHALEDRLRGRLVERKPHLQALVDVLHHEHRCLTRQGRRLHKLVGEVLDGLIVPREQLERVGRSYIAGYREHMDREEAELYPALATSLTATDWLKVVTAFDWQSNPQSIALAGRDYRSLHERITSEAGGFWPGAADAPSSCPVCAID